MRRFFFKKREEIMSSIFDWSKTEWDNQTADSGINWREGQLPSTINDSARMMMVRLAEFIADTQGYIETTGNGSTYYGKTSMSFTSYHTRLQFNILANVDCKDSASLSINNLPALPLVKREQNGLVPLKSLDLLAGDIYTVHYLPEFKDSNRSPCWKIYQQPHQALPAGMIYAFAGPKQLIPGWLYCNGQQVLKSDYPLLYLAIGDNWGRCSDKKYFCLPDLRGSFLRGIDDGRNLDADPKRKLASKQNSTFAKHSHGATISKNENHIHEIEYYGGSGNNIDINHHPAVFLTTAVGKINRLKVTITPKS